MFGDVEICSLCLCGDKRIVHACRGYSKCDCGKKWVKVTKNQEQLKIKWLASLFVHQLSQTWNAIGAITVSVKVSLEKVLTPKHRSGKSASVMLELWCLLWTLSTSSVCFMFETNSIWCAEWTPMCRSTARMETVSINTNSSTWCSKAIWQFNARYMFQSLGSRWGAWPRTLHIRTLVVHEGTLWCRWHC